METKFFDMGLEVKEVQESGMFTGYASTFGGDPDSYGDVIAPGAFKNTLAENGYGGNGIKMLWQHDPQEPIGVWSQIREDKRGLFVEGQLALGTNEGRRAYELLKIGALNTMSIGFRIKAYSQDDKKETRTLEEIELYEISLVTFPANTNAQITNVKTTKDLEAAMRDDRAFEHFLRDAKGLSREAAKTVVSLCKAGLNRGRDASISTLVEAIKAETDKLRGNCGTPTKSI